MRAPFALSGRCDTPADPGAVRQYPPLCPRSRVRDRAETGSSSRKGYRADPAYGPQFRIGFDSAPFRALKAHETGEFQMPTMSNLRRRKIQNKQLKAENAQKRIAKAAKKVRNAKKAG
jgi:hypothetical protein